MSRRTSIAVIVAALVLGLSPLAGPAGASVAERHGGHRPALAWQLTDTGSTERFRGLDAVDRRVAWVGSTSGSVLRTVDGGQSWQDVSPPDSAALQFRDVEAFGSSRALVLAIGTGEASRVYRTVDGGQTWSLAFQNHVPTAFYDCMAFFDHRRGLALSDPVDGKFQIVATQDGGRTWQVLPGSGMPDALTDEFAFAASGTCLTTAGPRDAWFGTGGGAQARVFHSRDGGLTWTVAATPIQSTPSSGIFSLAFRDTRRGFAIGGDFEPPNAAVDALAVTEDGGGTWDLVDAADAPDGFRSGSAWLSRLFGVALVVGPTGSDISLNGGHSWRQFDSGSFDSVECAPFGACWASGEQGRVARLVIRR